MAATEKNERRRGLRDFHVIIFVVAVLIFFYVFSFFVDIYNFLGIRDWMVAHDRLSVPFMWNYLFTEGGPVEIMQWLFIALVTMTGAYISGKLHALGKNKQVATFWLLFAVLGVLMIMEDAGNVRHFLTTRGTLLFVDRMIVRSITELSYFGLMAIIPAYAVLRYGRYLLPSKKTAVLLLLGCFFYAVAVGMSGTRDIMFWYQTAGTIFYDFSVALGGEELLEIYEKTDEYLADIGSISLRYRFMDYVVEESFELLGASFLWASSLSYLEYMNKEYGV